MVLIDLHFRFGRDDEAHSGNRTTGKDGIISVICHRTETKYFFMLGSRIMPSSGVLSISRIVRT